MELADFCGSSASTDGKLEAMELLEEYWFFENLFDTRTIMDKSSSDPSLSPKNCQKISAKSPANELPSSVAEVPRKDSSARHSLRRAPSLPPCIGRGRLSEEEEEEEEERHHAMSKLTRQASLNSSDILPPRHTSKNMTPSPSIPKHRARRESKVVSPNQDTKNQGCSSKEKIPKRLTHRKSRKSLSDLEFEELQGFKDLGFTFNKEDLSPTVVNIIPALKEKTQQNWDEDNKVRRPYLSEAWLVQRSASPMPNWVHSESAGDMKAHLKFWARVVASNVRQEC
ncbi:PREDICTED: uncharacterized protein LOC104613196 [Nelumbo nucifera]|uniref:Uncharacterized protein n=2 Tax=Nelumbo nucifera TaxID=4432 RepID=A0A822XL42_NELNU|nr:PREDICTED: uncharacterized protein LOC104613196 [Nelumbo nucifera]DAD21090.1 TPA_asm: hypothetical protein HUJ06_022553 [Nelumbo nucifera]